MKEPQEGTWIDAERITRSTPVKSEMQELIAAAERIIEVLDKGAIPVESKERLQASIAAARSSEGGWIDCKQKLPDLEVKCLVVANGEVWTAELENNGGYSWIGHSDIWGFRDITHWQPLPSPPLSVETPEVQK